MSEHQDDLIEASLRSANPTLDPAFRDRLIFEAGVATARKQRGNATGWKVATGVLAISTLGLAAMQFTAPQSTFGPERTQELIVESRPVESTTPWPVIDDGSVLRASDYRLTSMTKMPMRSVASDRPNDSTLDNTQTPRVLTPTSSLHDLNSI